MSFTADRLDNNRYYWHVFDPTKDTQIEFVCGDLLDDLTDIYQDLKNSIFLFESDKPEKIETAVWNLKWSFDNHWDDHDINASYALHYFINKTE